MTTFPAERVLAAPPKTRHDKRSFCATIKVFSERNCWAQNVQRFGLFRVMGFWRSGLAHNNWFVAYTAVEGVFNLWGKTRMPGVNSPLGRRRSPAL